MLMASYKTINREVLRRVETMTVMSKRILGIGAAVLLLSAMAVGATPSPASPPDDTNLRMSSQIRKAPVTLPYYGVFDNLEYKIEGGTVTLSGQVVRPTTRNDAEHRVARIEGVDRVVNNIEVLPLSSFDDSIRARTYRAVFRSGSLYRYAMGANPSVHIIVDNGRVTLEGVVSTRMDSQLAYMAANGVPGVFHVTNNLRVTKGSKSAAPGRARAGWVNPPGLLLYPAAFFRYPYFRGVYRSRRPGV